MIPSIYINLEDDVSKIVARVKKERSSELILVCPKRCFLFNDSINLRLLKKQADLLEKKVFILTMDERGQTYAKEAGFELKNLPKAAASKGFSDIVARPKAGADLTAGSLVENKVEKAVAGIKNLANNLMGVGAEIPKPVKESLNSQYAIPEEEKYVFDPSNKKSTQSIFPKELEATYKKQKNRKKLSRLIMAFVFIAAVLAVLTVFVYLPKAEVAIYPKTQSLTRDLTISLSTQAKAPDPEGQILPAVKISQTKSVQNNFQSQGKKEVGNKASGSAVIYNFTGAPINLRAKTTLLILNNKNYELKSDVMQLKPTRYKNAKTKEIDESSLGPPVDVEAAMGGESYNVPSGTRLEVTNQVFGSKPQLLYAKAYTAITGGTTRYLSFISQDDINSAKTALQHQIFIEVADQQAKNGMVLEEQAFTLKNPQFVFDREVGTETPNFTGKISAEALGLVYSRSDLEKTVLSRISKSLTSQGNIEVKLISPLAVKIKSADFAAETVSLDVHFDGVAIAVLPDLGDLASKMTGKSQEAAASYIKSRSEVDKVEITLSVGWQTWMPWLKNNIKIIKK